MSMFSWGGRWACYICDVGAKYLIPPQKSRGWIEVSEEKIGERSMEFDRLEVFAEAETLGGISHLIALFMVRTKSGAAR